MFATITHLRSLYIVIVVLGICCTCISIGIYLIPKLNLSPPLKKITQYDVSALYDYLIAIMNIVVIESWWKGLLIALFSLRDTHGQTDRYLLSLTQEKKTGRKSDSRNFKWISILRFHNFFLRAGRVALVSHSYPLIHFSNSTSTTTSHWRRSR